jgi:uncharacterized peroxidase-related enzyme
LNKKQLESIHQYTGSELEHMQCWLKKEIHKSPIAVVQLTEGEPPSPDLNYSSQMFLQEIQSRPPEGMMRVAFAKMNETGQGIPEILHLFRFKKRSTDHLARFTEEVMRGPSPLSRGIRELIGAYVSSRNQCCFCSCAHAPVAARLLGQDLVDEVLHDVESSRLDLRHKELFRYVRKLAENPALVTSMDISRLKESGWSEEAIYDALTVAAVFKFYNTWNNGAGVEQMSSSDYVHSGERLITMGYCMDFGWKAILRIIWVGRKEVRFTDLKELVKIALAGCIGAIGRSQKGVEHARSARDDSGAGSPAVCESQSCQEQPLAVALRESGDPAS